MKITIELVEEFDDDFAQEICTLINTSLDNSPGFVVEEWVGDTLTISADISLDEAEEFSTLIADILCDCDIDYHVVEPIMEGEA